MHHPIVFVTVADKDAANTALENLLGEDYANTFADAQASPDGTPPATEYYASFGVDNDTFAALSSLWANSFPTGGIYDAIPGQTYPALMAALGERGLLRVEEP